MVSKAVATPNRAKWKMELTLVFISRTADLRMKIARSMVKTV